ncbi:Rv3235 family protein [Kocuria sp. LUK]|uniref:Rv3235 family protein n=1 Tax=Kocuria TaxID=57493 RepID=UPI001C5F0732|nr:MULTISPECIES: Rv3235 family protein [Kocuria]MCD1145738.1 Rv3235 family protein [Kocuria sp. LUK]
MSTTAGSDPAAPTVPAPRPPVPARAPAASGRSGPPTAPGGYRWGAARTVTAGPGDEQSRVTALARSIGQAAVEVLGGSRPAAQLARWTTPEIVQRFQLRAEMLRLLQEQFENKPQLQELHRNPHVRRCRACRVRPGVYEVALVVDEPRRARAVALRVERLGRGWCVTELEVG